MSSLIWVLPTQWVSTINNPLYCSWWRIRCILTSHWQEEQNVPYGCLLASVKVHFCYTAGNTYRHGCIFVAIWQPRTRRHCTSYRCSVMPSTTHYPQFYVKMRPNYTVDEIEVIVSGVEKNSKVSAVKKLLTVTDTKTAPNMKTSHIMIISLFCYAIYSALSIV